MSDAELQNLREENARLRREIASLKSHQPECLNKNSAEHEQRMLPKEVVPCAKEHNLSNLQVQRYSRQLILKSFGLEAQARLCSSSALVVGAGGLGSSIALYLSGAGVGKLGVVDKDTVSLDNLHRQIIHKESHVGMEKTVSARLACLELNSSIEVKLHSDGFHPERALELVDQYDVVIDATDNVPTRYLVSDACVVAGKPLVSGAAIGTEGQLTVYNYGDDGPCYRCLFPQAPAPASCSSCSDAGVLGPVPGAVGVLQALEAIKILSKVGTCLSKKLLLMDFHSSQFRNVKLRGRVPDCIACGRTPLITRDSLAGYDYVNFTGQTFTEGPILCPVLLSQEHRISPEDAAQHLASNRKDTIILDVRANEEFQIGHLEGSINVPLPNWKSQLPNILSRCGLSPGVVNGADHPPQESSMSNVLVVCRRGNDSQVAVDMLKKSGVSGAKDMIGGLNAWADRVDPNMPKY